jgi:hypothetical protein
MTVREYHSCKSRTSIISFLLFSDSLTPPPAAERDPDYYYEDGSTILLVDDVLFKVSTWTLNIE